MSAVEDYFEDSQLEAKQANYLSQDDNPDEAAEAVELSDSTGVPASAIHSNLEDFKRQHKLALGNAIINDNQLSTLDDSTKALSPNMTSTGPFTPLGFKPRLLVLRRKWWVWVRSVWKASPA